MQQAKLNSLNDLLIHDIQDLLSAEQILSGELPDLSDRASNRSLKDKLQDYSNDANDQVQKFNQIFQMMGVPVQAEECKGMQGLVDETNEVVDMIGDPNVRDAAIIAAVQKMKHYEISAYGTARTYADMLGRQDVARVLADTLNEEELTDRELTDLAMANVNKQAKAA